MKILVIFEIRPGDVEFYELDGKNLAWYQRCHGHILSSRGEPEWLQERIDRIKDEGKLIYSNNPAFCLENPPILGRSDDWLVVWTGFEESPEA